MRLPVTSAPGKLVLVGEYAVLEGHAALVAAVDRRVRFGPNVGGAPAMDVPEVAAALIDADLASPDDIDVDTSALHHGTHKLGLGSSAASAVAATGALFAARGDVLSTTAVRERVLEAAMEAHARVQRGGSGIDVAASTFGGVLRFQRFDGSSVVTPRLWPPGLHLGVAFTGQPARTSDMVAGVRAFATRDPRGYKRQISGVADAAQRFDEAMERGDSAACIEQLWRAGSAVESLGMAAELPIVPRNVRLLREALRYEGVAVKTSGAGAGDCVIALSPERAALTVFARECGRIGLLPIALAVDMEGVRLEPNVRRDSPPPTFGMPSPGGRA